MNEADPLDNPTMTFAEIAVRLGITEAEARQAFWSGMVKLRRYFQTRPKLMATFKDLLRREAGLRPEKIRFRGGWKEDTFETELRGTEEE